MHNQVLLLGSNGFLGRHFARTLESDAVKHSSREIKGLNDQVYARFETSDEIISFINNFDAETVINCIATADIESCEKNPELAKWVNTDIPRILAETCEKRGKQLIHFSTDAVFDGRKKFAGENDKPEPLSVYGKTKLEGERRVLTENKKSLTFRVNFFGDSQEKNSLYNFFKKSAEENIQVRGFHDLYFTPLYVEHLVKVVIDNMNKLQPGLYHLVGSERISKYEFGVGVFESFGKSRDLVIPTSAMKEGSKIRSLDLSLSNSKLAKYGVTFPSYQLGLEHLSQIHLKEQNEENC